MGQRDERGEEMRLRVGNHGSVVSDDQIPNGVQGTEDFQAYGGFLFCETITRDNAAELVKRWNKYEEEMKNGK